MFSSIPVGMSTDIRKESKSAFETFQKEGNDLRKYLANKIGLPDVQTDKIASMLEKARAEEEARSKKQSKEIEKEEKMPSKNKQKDENLKHKINKMTPKEIAKDLDVMFKSYLAEKMLL